MRHLNEVIKSQILLKERGHKPITLLAVCPNSAAVLEGAVKAAARNRSIMLFAATLNQVDVESSYTGWTPTDFVRLMNAYASKYHWSGPLYPCLDHGGPWLKDLHTLANLTYSETMDKVKTSISACILAGYKLLHIDPTVDRTLTSDQPLALETIVERTVELISHAEQVRQEVGLPRLDYEVGTEEVHGGLVDLDRFVQFLELLKDQLRKKSLRGCWPCLFVAQVGTDLHTTMFDSHSAHQLYYILAAKGSMVKGHYTDWVKNPELYPETGMGAANVGPEFTVVEFNALKELEKREQNWINNTSLQPSGMVDTLQNVVVESGRWKKWLSPNEVGSKFTELVSDRQEWLVKTGSRYIWTDHRVVAARERLYKNLSKHGQDPHAYVVEKIANSVERYIKAFNLHNSIDLLG